MKRMLSPRLWLAIWLGSVQLPAAAATPASVGYLDERALSFHEAWFEARLSLKPQQLELEWAKLVRFLEASLKGRARVAAAGTGADWRVVLKPPSGPMSVQVDPSGARVMAPRDSNPMEPRTLISVYPLRRHYDCEGRPLNPAMPGIPVSGKPCALPAQTQWQAVAGAVAADDSVVVQPMKGFAGCYRVISDTRDVLRPGQVLVEQAGQPYKMQPLADDKLRMLYSDNQRLFVMEGKQPSVYTLR